MIVNLRGEPEAPSDVVRRLRAIDSRLGLVFIAGDPGSYPDQWAITDAWGPNDPRWGKVQKGQLAGERAYDIIGFLPQDCSPAEAHSYVMRAFKRWSGRKDECAKWLQKLDDWNEKQEQRNFQPTVALAEELIDANSATLFRDMGKTAPVFRGGFADLKGK